MTVPYRWLNKPDDWHPDGMYPDVRIPEAGDLLGWRYAAWRVVEVKIYDDADMSEASLKRLAIWKPEVRDQMRPYALMLRHELGPNLADRSKKWHDGTPVTHVGGNAGDQYRWCVLGERYALCNCCGHLWPCQALHRDQLAAVEAEQMATLMERSAPGLCTGCGDGITTRQKWMQFPEDSLLVPGMPGPMFHTGKSECHAAAAEYERNTRLKVFPDVTRLVSCAGYLFVHAATLLEECTAGPMCAGLDAHGPRSAGRKDGWCTHRRNWASNDGAYPVPLTNCGYDEGGSTCLGGDISGGSSATNEIAGDLIRESRRPR